MQYKNTAKCIYYMVHNAILSEYVSSITLIASQTLPRKFKFSKNQTSLRTISFDLRNKLETLITGAETID